MNESYLEIARTAANRARNSVCPYAGELSAVLSEMHEIMRPGRVRRGKEYKAWLVEANEAAREAIHEIGQVRPYQNF